MKIVGMVLRVVVVMLVVGGGGYFLYLQAKPLLAEPCAQPLFYSVAGYDERFKLTEAEFSNALAKAAGVWNAALGKELVRVGEGGIAVEMQYGEVQQTSELGTVISSEQAQYNAKRVQVETLKEDFTIAKRKYELLVASYTSLKEEYEAQVQYWNEQGGAPKKEYNALQAEGERLQEQTEKVNEQVTLVNALAGELNSRVDELNVLARSLNTQVSTFNEHADTDFDQGRYVRDASGEHIFIYEFTSEEELVRVLTHEFGHALGLDHVENPDSIMYSYNVGNELVLTSEDKAELARVCRLD